MKTQKNTDYQKISNKNNIVGLRFDISTCKSIDIILLIQDKSLELNNLLTKSNRLPYHNWFIKDLKEQLEILNNELIIRKDINSWIASENVIQLSNNQFLEQTTQWKKIFNETDLIKFFKREYLNI